MGPNKRREEGRGLNIWSTVGVPQKLDLCEGMMITQGWTVAVWSRIWLLPKEQAACLEKTQNANTEFLFSTQFVY